jgi:hypothetical protein
MVTRYTDVDLMILKRWDEVNGLREAYDHLLGRIDEVVETSVQKASVAASELGWSSDYDLKRPTMWFWKREWATKKNESGVCIQLFDFVPADCGKGVEDHPSMWLITSDWSKLRMHESSEEFGRAVRASLPPELQTKWRHDESDVSESPLGRHCTDISESDRVRLVADPDALNAFIMQRIEEFTELVPAIDEALKTMTRR